MRSRHYSKKPRQIIVIAHNIRSIQNIGSILRTADCLGIKKVVASGYTPNLECTTDGTNQPLLPHIKDKLAHKLHTVALGAECSVDFRYQPSITHYLNDLKQSGFTIVGLEQAASAISLPDYQPTDKIALLLGEEVSGLTDDIIKNCDHLVEIPMYGNKESYNVAIATSIALYDIIVNK